MNKEFIKIKNFVCRIKDIKCFEYVGDVLRISFYNEASSVLYVTRDEYEEFEKILMNAD